MDTKKIGSEIAELRKAKGWTQRQLAEQLHVTDKAVSKWETGQGCPDISLLGVLSEVMEVSLENLLEGDISPNERDRGNMKRMKFYICPICGTVLTATGQAEITCCGRKLSALAAKPVDEGHQPTVEFIENDYYVAFDHPMTKEHYLAFAAWVTYDQMLLMRLYPEQDAEVRFPKIKKGKLYIYCNQDGLWEVRL
ncbi:MAG: helix-turn-helix domain-containing protein [Firmicutes bacterium]|jgi:desulfoferrodoxin (superoxide reductase-like protein)/DNA-binding XRE family transcriptional regulator|nr:helix-turn-helix domain-containing protein [Bacillota bacterium]